MRPTRPRHPVRYVVQLPLQPRRVAVALQQLRNRQRRGAAGGPPAVRLPTARPLVPRASAMGLVLVVVRVEVGVGVGVCWGRQRHGHLQEDGVGAHVGDVGGNAALQEFGEWRGGERRGGEVMKTCSWVVDNAAWRVGW